MNFDHLLKRFQNRRINIAECSEYTASRYVKHVRRWKDWLEENQNKTLWEAETTDLRIYVEDLKFDGLAPTTISQFVSGISTFYQDCQKLDNRGDLSDVPENPYDGFDKQDKKMLRGDTKKQKSLEESDGDKYLYLEPDEVKQLINNVPAPRLRNELLIRLMFDCGFRRGELAHSKVEHINDDNTIRIPPRKSEGRTVGFRENTAVLLDRWLNNGGRDSMANAPNSDYLFPTNNSKNISDEYINQIVKETAESAGIQETTPNYSDGRNQHKITAHVLRHSFAMDKLEVVDVTTLQKLMGHTDIDTTMTYVNMSDEAARNKSKQFTDF